MSNRVHGKQMKINSIKARIGGFSSIQAVRSAWGLHLYHKSINNVINMSTAPTIPQEKWLSTAWSSVSFLKILSIVLLSKVFIPSIQNQSTLNSRFWLYAGFCLSFSLRSLHIPKSLSLNTAKIFKREWKCKCEKQCLYCEDCVRTS